MTVIDELQALDLQLAGLHQRTPYAIHDVTHGQMSIARHYGCLTFQHEPYTYFAESDELVRDDVLAYIRKAAKVTGKASRAIARMEREKWQALQKGLI